MRCRCALCGVVTGRWHQHLQKQHALSVEQYILQIEHLNVRPLCLCGCGSAAPFRKTKFEKFISGHNTRGKVYSDAEKEILCRALNKPETKAKRAATNARSEVKKRRSEATRECQNRPDVIEKKKRIWSDPDRLKKHSEIAVRISSREDVKEKRSRGMKNAWIQPAYRSKMLKALNRPETAQKFSENAKRTNARLWADPAYRDRMAKLWNETNWLRKQSKPEFALHARLIEIFGSDRVKRCVCLPVGKSRRFFDVSLEICGQKILIESDGIYWHGLDIAAADLKPHQKKKRIIDQLKDIVGAMAGFDVLRLREDIDLSKIVDLDSLYTTAYKVTHTEHEAYRVIDEV